MTSVASEPSTIESVMLITGDRPSCVLMPVNVFSVRPTRNSSVTITVVSLTMTVTLAVATGLPAASWAVTVRTFDPIWRTMPLAVQAVVPNAVPLPPRLFVQSTRVTPTLADAVPSSVREELLTAVGAVMVTVGGGGGGGGSGSGSGGGRAPSRVGLLASCVASFVSAGGRAPTMGGGTFGLTAR